MNPTEIQILLKDMESERAERKSSISDPSSIRHTICAFANDLPDHREPGVLFIGVNDDGTCASLGITDQLLTRVTDFRSDGKILPLPRIEVRKETIEGCDIIVVIVHPSDSTPLRCDGRVYVRVGPTTRVATAEEERRLLEKSRSHNLPFDQRPAPATVDDLDLDLFTNMYLPRAVAPEILEANSRTTLEQLASMRFLSSDDIPTYAGALTFGRDPRNILPGAYIQFVRHDGRELTDAIKDQKMIDGPLPQVLSTLDDMIKLNISSALDMSSDVETVKPDYPLVALQQLIRNAVLHRNYEGTNAPVRFHWFSDRVEIHSPGGPYGQVTRENFGQPNVTDYRNPKLAEAMRVLGYVQHFGIGIQMARKELEANKNPELEFTVEASFILVTVRGRQ